MKTKIKKSKSPTDKSAKPAKSSSSSATSQRAVGGGVSKKKHGLGKKEHALLPQLKASAPEERKRPLSAKAKQRQKRSAKSAILGAVDGMRSTLDELLAANEQKHREQATLDDDEAGATMSSKKRQKLVAAETAHMQQVLEHPAFVADPFAALQEHLQNTVGAIADKRDKKKGRGKEHQRDMS